MKTIRWTSAFKADYKKLERSPRYRYAIVLLETVTRQLAADEPLDTRFRDHALVGEWKDCRECHLAPNLLLIYRYEGESTIAFARLGTHSELFR